MIHGVALEDRWLPGIVGVQSELRLAMIADLIVSGYGREIPGNLFLLPMATVILEVRTIGIL